MMASFVLAAIVGLLVGLATHTLAPADRRSPLWLNASTGIAAALLGTTAARLAGAPSSSPESMPAVLLVPLFFAGVGLAVLAFATGKSARERR